MQSNPLISVIVPVFNTFEYLKKCVDSILEQSYKNLEIILVDDGSSDESGKLCDEYALKDERIKVIHKENGGLSSARNEGLEKAKGEWIQFVDSDDYIAPEMIEIMLSSSLKNDTLISVCGRYDVDFESQKQTMGLCPLENEVILAKEALARFMTWQGVDFSACDKLFHKSLWEDMRFPVGMLSEDVAVMYKIIDKTSKISMVNKPLYYYVHRKSSITTYKFSEKSFHYPMHTLEILKWVRENYKDIEVEALSMRIRSVSWILTELSSQKGYAKECKGFYKELKENRKFWIKSNIFSKKEKAINVLLLLKLFSLVKKIKEFLK